MEQGNGSMFLNLRTNTPKIEGNAMIVIAKLKAQAGKEAEMEKTILDVLPKVKTEEGTLAYNFHRSLGDPTVFVFYEKYVDQAALGAHSKTPHFKEMGKALAGLLDGAPEIEMLEELGNID
ncbi:MAG: antibiotic biosynthesis monooxygenase [Deltaproteobacteria bacterium]|nr:antibiotic biosynthesis monooxygenase [Deltaproteobacteria bacterium]